MTDADGSRANTEIEREVQDLKSELRVANAECEIRRRDSARLDFLERYHTTIEYTETGFVFLRIGVSTYAGGATLREAIDCFMHIEETD